MAETIISLTTIPPRLGGIVCVLESLLAQGADRVILALPSCWARFQAGAAMPDMPQGIEVLHCNDLGPISKVLPVRSAFPEADILYCDDDCLYQPGWLEALRGSGVRAGSVFDVARLKRRGKLVAQGFAGVFVPAGTPLPQTIPEEVRFADDLWLSAFWDARGIEIEAVADARRRVAPLDLAGGLQEDNRKDTYASAAGFIEKTLGVWPPL